MTATQNPFRELFTEGDILTYLGINMVVVAITDGQTDIPDLEQMPSMITEYLNAHNEIQKKVFYTYHIPALKVFKNA